MIGGWKLPMIAGGSDPDPAVFCPVNNYFDPDDPDSGVIWNPINPADGWYLLLEFQTNSSTPTTFDPSIGRLTGMYSWTLGDGFIVMDVLSISHQYSDSSVKTVKLFYKGTPSINSADFNTDNIIGDIDISSSVFAPITAIIFYTNPLLTSVVLPTTITGNVNSIRIYGTGVSSLDFSGITNVNNTLIYLWSNPNLTSVIFPPSVTGSVSQIYIYSCNITGVLDLSMFATFLASYSIQLHSNTNMTGVNFASSMTGFCSLLWIYSTGITGVLDLSKIAFNASASVYLNNNPLMTGVLLNATGKIITLRLYDNLTLGYVDFSALNTSISSLNWQMQNNGWTAAIVNQVLLDIDSISVGGFTSRSINIGGTNADPDTTSGGFDGVAARNSLIAKGFTVTIT